VDDLTRPAREHWLLAIVSDRSNGINSPFDVGAYGQLCGLKGGSGSYCVIQGPLRNRIRNKLEAARFWHCLTKRCHGRSNPSGPWCVAIGLNVDVVSLGETVDEAFCNL
jgi:hypothetical protein